MLGDYLTRVAAAYARAEHSPDDAHVQRCYRAFERAIDAQYSLVTAFVRVEFTEDDPYPLSEPMWADIAAGHIKVYTFAELPADHPMQAFNLQFRAVHDVLAHYPERLHHDGLDAEPGHDEFRAFRAHARLLCGNGEAIRALFTETVAQNATYHYGSVRHVFAAQKATLLPEALIMEGLTL